MWIVKLGGSLINTSELKHWLSLANDYHEQICIIPGGGPFADSIRELQKQYLFDDKTAHNMALTAMEQFAWYCQSLQENLIFCRSLDEVTQQLYTPGLCCFLPGQFLHELELDEKNWTLTSDSIAALFAIQSQADGLILVKSISHINQANSIEVLCNSSVLDTAFEKISQQFSGSIHCLGRHDTEIFPQLLTAH